MQSHPKPERKQGFDSRTGRDGSVVLSVGKIEADLSSEVLASLTFVAACEVGVRRVPVPSGGDRGRGAVVSAVQFVLSRR
jgi:hypothetical protein